MVSPPGFAPGPTPSQSGMLLLHHGDIVIDQLANGHPRQVNQVGCQKTFALIRGHSRREAIRIPIQRE